MGVGINEAGGEDSEVDVIGDDCLSGSAAISEHQLCQAFSLQSSTYRKIESDRMSLCDLLELALKAC